MDPVMQKISQIMANEQKNRNNTEVNTSEQAKTDTKRDEYTSHSGNVSNAIFVCFHLERPDERASESRNINRNKSLSLLLSFLLQLKQKKRLN